jgi:hypothetical protein
VSWIRARRSGGSIRRTGYARATVLAIYKYHETGNAEAASAYLSHTIASNSLTNAGRARIAEGQLASYVIWCVAERPIVGGYRLRINLPLGEGIELRGEISRLDVDQEGAGYRAVLLGSLRQGWSTELRMPLIQRAIAHAIERPEADVAVACQMLDGTDLQVVRFDSGDIDEAVEVALQLAATIANL